MSIKAIKSKIGLFAILKSISADIAISNFASKLSVFCLVLEYGRQKTVINKDIMQIIPSNV